MRTCNALDHVSLPIAAQQGEAAPLDARGLQQEYLDIARGLDGDARSHEAGDSFLVSAGALYHGGPVQWSFVPRIFSKRDLGHLAWIAETMGAIMDKLTRRYLDDPTLRSMFGFTPDLEALTMLSCGYESLLPIARVDIFLNDETGDFKFCELNTDGSSGMLVTEEVSRAYMATETGRRFAERHDLSAFDVYGACAETVIGCYREAAGNVEFPTIAAVDYAESIAAEEIEVLSRVFPDHGAALRFCDIRDLSYENGVLRDAIGPIDCVWRRAVLSEMLEKPGSGPDALMACSREPHVPIVGGFRSWPCATKTVFSVLRDPYVAEFLTEEQLDFVRKHVPETYLLDQKSDLTRFSDRIRWIVKPRDGYNSIGVRAGLDCTDEQWVSVLEEMARTGGTIQEYVCPYSTMNVEGASSAAGSDPQMYMNMEGLYLFDGRFSGVFTRCGTNAVIGEAAGRLNMGCLVSDGPAKGLGMGSSRS
ncbi:hypothetical protein Corgl_1010 [Coriobacterium glomerans PW2]|uniref:Glutathionylspermidine synthase pre-ATP-grasp-like domain-containing protein n=1 Tax=Coriobacterium glomerans (strain ATCC 49209 / DSM 20642 / JCM 10262 / PW2) TaxID=700015 RepID=F2N809_CORGP|nr:hypothetical protein [Coriobacterium glomerans]AEB07118.1 hypothetical protein Corgl_1010 [Coriobacterium glomerans PW2]